MTDVGQNRKTGERKPMKELQKQLDMLIRKSGADMQVIEMIRNEPSVFPFSTEGKLMAYLLAGRIITYEEYLNLNREYNRRNQYLYLFDMAPRTFGEIWGENHVLQLFPEFVKATKEKLMFQYPGFDGEFDLLLDGIRVEVKACRANSTKFGGNLASRAYLHQEAHEHAFKYHYQQLKPSCCDVFLWIGVCRDELLGHQQRGADPDPAPRYTTPERKNRHSWSTCLRGSDLHDRGRTAPVPDRREGYCGSSQEEGKKVNGSFV